jgi:hypothetical protein
MESATSLNDNNTDLPSPPPGIPIDPLLLAWVPPASVPFAPVPATAPAPTTATTGSLVSPAAVVPPTSLQSTLPDHHYQRINSPAPAHGLPVVSAEQEQRILTTLSLPSVLQLDITIAPFAYLAAIPTAADMVQICDVPESLYGRVKLEMYPIQVQRRAVMRMWRAFHWKWSMEIDVKKFVSKQLNSRYLQSKNYKEKKMAEMWYADVAARISAGNPDAVGIVHAVAAANPDVPVVAAVVAHAAPSARVTVAAALAPVVGASSSSVAPVASLPAAAASSPDADAVVPSTTSSTSAANSSPVASPAAGASSPDGPDLSSPSASSSAASPPTTPSPAS